MANTTRADPGFSRINWLGVFLSPPTPSQGYPSALFCQYPFVHLGGESHYESKVSCPRTEHNDSMQCVLESCMLPAKPPGLPHTSNLTLGLIHASKFFDNDDVCFCGRTQLSQNTHGETNWEWYAAEVYQKGTVQVFIAPKLSQKSEKLLFLVNFNGFLLVLDKMALFKSCLPGM